MFQLKNIYQDGFNFPSSREEGRDSVLRAILLFVSLQVIELNVDSLIASFQQCEIGKRITKFFILSISFKWREDVIEIELPNIVYSVFSVTEINKIRNCLKSVISFLTRVLYIILYLQGSLVSSLICVLNLITSSLAPFIGLNFIRRCFSSPPVFSLMTE